MDPNVRVFGMPEAAREQILRLRTTDRPYPKLEWLKQALLREPGAIYGAVRPAIPSHMLLRDYQVEAVEAWFAEGCRGLLEMATGTGKTIASLTASVRLYEREGRLAVIIACPYRYLVDQWCEESRDFGYAPLRAYESRSTWLDELNERIEGVKCTEYPTGVDYSLRQLRRKT